MVLACAVLAPAVALVSPPAGLPAPVVAPALALLARGPRRCSVALSTSSQFQGSSDGVGAHTLAPRRPALRGRRAPLTVVLSPVDPSPRRSARLPLAPPMRLSSFFDSECAAPCAQSPLPVLERMAHSHPMLPLACGRDAWLSQLSLHPHEQAVLPKGSHPLLACGWNVPHFGVLTLHLPSLLSQAGARELEGVAREPLSPPSPPLILPGLSSLRGAGYSGWVPVSLDTSMPVGVEDDSHGCASLSATTTRGLHSLHPPQVCSSRAHSCLLVRLGIFPLPVSQLSFTGSRSRGVEVTTLSWCEESCTFSWSYSGVGLFAHVDYDLLMRRRRASLVSPLTSRWSLLVAQAWKAASTFGVCVAYFAAGASVSLSWTTSGVGCIFVAALASASRVLSEISFSRRGAYLACFFFTLRFSLSLVLSLFLFTLSGAVATMLLAFEVLRFLVTGIWWCGCVYLELGSVVLQGAVCIAPFCFIVDKIGGRLMFWGLMASTWLPVSPLALACA